MSHEFPASLEQAILKKCQLTDEPPEGQSLREDILAELRDHLLSAAVREQLADSSLANSDPDGSRLWKRVIDRFGDPARVARQLWWIKHWESLMSQRLTLISLTLLTGLCLGLSYLSWQSLTLSREALEQVQEATIQAQRRHDALMAQILNLANRPVPSATSSAPSEWNQVSLQLHFDQPDKAPVPGAVVQIAGISPNTRSLPLNSRETGADGLADFGKLLYGDYLVSIRLPHGAELLKRIGVSPGQDYRETIPCPASPKKPVSVKFLLPDEATQFPIPEELQSRIWTTVWFPRQPAEVLENVVMASAKPDFDSRKLNLSWTANSKSEVSAWVRSPEGLWFPFRDTPVSENYKPLENAQQLLGPEEIRFLDIKTGPFIVDGAPTFESRILLLDIEKLGDGIPEEQFQVELGLLKTPPLLISTWRSAAAMATDTSPLWANTVCLSEQTSGRFRSPCEISLFETNLPRIPTKLVQPYHWIPSCQTNPSRSR